MLPWGIKSATLPPPARCRDHHEHPAADSTPLLPPSAPRRDHHQHPAATTTLQAPVERVPSRDRSTTRVSVTGKGRGEGEHHGDQSFSPKKPSPGALPFRIRCSRLSEMSSQTRNSLAGMRVKKSLMQMPAGQMRTSSTYLSVAELARLPVCKVKGEKGKKQARRGADPEGTYSSREAANSQELAATDPQLNRGRPT